MLLRWAYYGAYRGLIGTEVTMYHIESRYKNVGCIERVFVPVKV